MAFRKPIVWARKKLRSLNRRDALTERVKRTLVGTLYTQPASLAVGALCGTAAAGVVAYQTADSFLLCMAALIALIATMRTVAAYHLADSSSDVSTKKLEYIYEIGAFSYALVLGVVAAITVVAQYPAHLQLLMVTVSSCYGISICARNAGRPAIALGQLSFSTVPIICALLWVGTLSFIVLAVIMLFMLPAMATITLSVHRALRKSISEAETSAQLAQQMQLLARTDVVTGLANRAGLNHSMIEKLMSVEDQTMLAMFWLDLDRFKEVNDLLGHPIGDKVLAEIAKRLSKVAPGGATVSRFGGDEFIVFCEVTSRSDAERIASIMKDEVTRPIRIDSDRLEVGVSIGIALLPDDGTDADSLMQASDLALYHAKVNGRNQTQFFAQEMTRDLVRRREIEEELRLALQRDELSIFFQPIVDLETGRIRTFEALVRWFHPEKGELRPDEFIPVAEECGAIITLGNWITKQAALACAQWPEDVTIAVNLSPLQIKAPGAALGILTALRDAKLDPSRMELEVTESLFLDDDQNTAAFIEELSAAGVRFAMDDFGTGYSSLGYINKYPFSKIKVDRSFVSGKNVGKRSDAIIRAVAEMGVTLDMQIVAEGLETVEQVAAVREAGCTLGQGYYFSRAVPDYLAAMLLAQERDIDEKKRLAG